MEFQDEVSHISIVPLSSPEERADPVGFQSRALTSSVCWERF